MFISHRNGWRKAQIIKRRVINKLARSGFCEYESMQFLEYRLYLNHCQTLSSLETKSGTRNVDARVFKQTLMPTISLVLHYKSE